MRTIYLVSNSPRRIELFKTVQLPYKLISNSFEEVVPQSMDNPSEYAMKQAKAKLSTIMPRGNAIYTAFDTIVYIDGQILGKPSTKDDARNMLRLLSGNSHTVYTGIAIKDNEKLLVDYEATTVKFYPLTDEVISAYIMTGEPFDKAGAYGIQCKGSFLVERIDGCYFNIIGLPLPKFARMLLHFEWRLEEIIRWQKT